jgi:hypothetical protein
LASVRRLRQLPAAGHGDVQAALQALRPSTRAQLEQVVRGLPDASPVAELLLRVYEAPTRDAAVAETNLQLAEVSRELDVQAEVPRSSARIALASGTVLALLRVIGDLNAGQPGGWLWALAPFAGGTLSALICAQLGRMAGERARSYREAWNGLSRRLLQAVESGPPGGVPSDRTVDM